MNTKRDLENQIEQLRIKMYHASENNLNDDKVIQLSQDLDALLNQLDALKEKK